MSDALSFYYLFRSLEQVAGRVKEDRATRNSASIQIAYAENFSCLLRLGYGRTDCEGGNGRPSNMAPRGILGFLESNNPTPFRFWILGFGLFTTSLVRRSMNRNHPLCSAHRSCFSME